MTYESIFQMLKGIEGYSDVAYRLFPKDKVPPLPYIVYYTESSNNVAADNQVFVHAEELVIEAYFDQEYGKRPDLEQNIENTLNQNHIVWDKEEEFIESENLIEIIYTTEVIIDNG